MKNYLLATLLSLSLLGCGTATFEAADVKSDYRGKINQVSVLLQVDSLEEAFMLGASGSTELEVKRRDVMSTKYVAAVAAIKQGLVENFRKAGVVATVTSARNNAEITAQIGAIKDSQILHARVVSYMIAIKPNGYRYWDSGLTWELSFYDRNRAVNPTGGVVWRTKTGMMMFNFGCGDDYLDCGDRFGRSIMDELKRVELIPKQ